MERPDTEDDALKEEAEFNEYMKDKAKDQNKKEVAKTPDISSDFLDKIQDALTPKKDDKHIVKAISEQIKIANEEVAKVRSFEDYFKPYQETRTILWNELGKVNQFDLPINLNAGNPLKKPNFGRNITLYFNSASKEQMQHMEYLRAKSQDLDRIERISNSMSTDAIEKKGLIIPKNFLTISSDAARAKEDLLTARICILCGVEEEAAKNIIGIADAQMLDQILDSWEYRNRTGYPNSNTGPTRSTSSSGYL